MAETGSPQRFAISTTLLGDADAMKNAVAEIGTVARQAVQDLAAFVIALRPPEQRETGELQTQVEVLTRRLAALREQIAEYEGDSLGGRIARALDFSGARIDLLRNTVDEVEAELVRLRGILSQRIDPTFVRPDWSPALEASIEVLRRQTRELEIQAATFGMTAAQAARYRAELEMIRMFSDEDGPRGPIFDARRAEFEREAERNARAAQVRADQALGRTERGIWQSAEARADLAEAEAEAVGRTAAETARLRFEQ